MCSLWVCLCAAGGVTLTLVRGRQAPVSLLYHLPLAPVHNVSGNASRGGGVAVGYREACLSNVTAVAEVAEMAGLEVRPARPCPCPCRCRCVCVGARVTKRTGSHQCAEGLESVREGGGGSDTRAQPGRGVRAARAERGEGERARWADSDGYADTGDGEPVTSSIPSD